MNLVTLEMLFQRVAEHLNTHNLPGFTFYWHGGEPLLQPISFYEHIAGFQQRYLAKFKILHLLQTNGTRLTREYARVLKQLGIVVALSLDGPPDVNDKLRVDRLGRPTSGRVLKGLNILREEGHPVQILCVITPNAIGKGSELYHYFRDLGTVWMDFLLPHANRQHTTIAPEIMPSQSDLASLYIDIYREWMIEGNPDVCIRRLRDYVQLLLGGEPDTCIFGDGCSHIITVSSDGNLYACDDLLSTFPNRIGSLEHGPLDHAANHPVMCFLCQKRTSMVGKGCLECDYFDVCRAGCSNFRASPQKTFDDPYFYCQMSRLIIDYIRQDLIARLNPPNGLIPKAR